MDSMEKIKYPGLISIVDMKDQIKSARTSCGLSQEEAGKYCGVSSTTFQRWEYGTTSMVRKTNYDKLCDILNGNLSDSDA